MGLHSAQWNLQKRTLRDLAFCPLYACTCSIVKFFIWDIKPVLYMEVFFYSVLYTECPLSEVLCTVSCVSAEWVLVECLSRDINRNMMHLVYCKHMYMYYIVYVHCILLYCFVL